MIRRPPRSTRVRSSAASDVYKRQVQWKPAGGGDETLGLVDFSIYPHLAPEGVPGNTMADAERWAAEIDGQAYAIDDDTAIRVVDGTVEVVSEGNWRLFSPSR